jgi:hypothetical protein
MVTVGSNLKMHASRLTGGVDYKDGVEVGTERHPVNIQRLLTPE